MKSKHVVAAFILVAVFLVAGGYIMYRGAEQATAAEFDDMDTYLSELEDLINLEDQENIDGLDLILDVGI